MCAPLCFLYGYGMSLGLFLYRSGTDWGTIEFDVLLQSRSRCTSTTPLYGPQLLLHLQMAFSVQLHRSLCVTRSDEEAADVFLCWLAYFQLLFLNPQPLLFPVNAQLFVFNILYLLCQLLWTQVFVGSTILYFKCLSPKSFLWFISS